MILLPPGWLLVLISPCCRPGAYPESLADFGHRRPAPAPSRLRNYDAWRLHCGWPLEFEANFILTSSDPFRQYPVFIESNQRTCLLQQIVHGNIVIRQLISSARSLGKECLHFVQLVETELVQECQQVLFISAFDSLPCCISS